MQGQIFFSGFIEDLTKEKERQKETRSRRDLYRTVIDQANEGILVVDSTGKIEVSLDASFPPILSCASIDPPVDKTKRTREYHALFSRP